MIVQEPLIDELFASNWIKYGFEVLVIIAVIGIGTQMKKRKARLREAAQAQV
ncbi:hypothetical protein HMSSN036_09970 [Paenibacillus macerans]|nr:hypothetical protein HMSSN036_09970 [Paenibacillus macerans]